MKMPNTIKVPRAFKTRSNFPLNSVHMTTMDFARTNCTYARKVVATDKFKIELDSFVQLAPMVVPTMGSAKLYTRFFFVPYRFLWRSWESFASQKSVDDDGFSFGSKVPLITAHDIAIHFFGVLCVTASAPSVGYSDPWGLWTVVASTSVYDFKVHKYNTTSSNEYDVYVRLTPKGCDELQILQALGYNLIPVVGSKYNSSQGGWQYPKTEDITYSALPLLALGKVFVDYYNNPNFNFSYLVSWFTDKVRGGKINSQGVPTFIYPHDNTTTSNMFGVDILETARYCWFENDPFTSAWANPETIGYSGIYQTQQIEPTSYSPDTGSEAVASAVNSGGNAYVTAYQPDTNNLITQVGLNVLKQLRIFVGRQSAAGGRFIDQLLAKTGIRLSNNEARRSEFLGSIESNIEISRVNATAAGSDGAGNLTQLGDFAGRGTMSGRGSIQFDNDHNDDGIILALSHIVPDTHYFQGDLPHTLEEDYFDFFNGDMENVSNAPIPNRVLFNDYNAVSDSDGTAVKTDIDGIFGFSANYFGDKIPFDRLTGDFRLGSRNTDLDSFHMFRRLAAPSASADNAAVLGSNFMRYSDTAVQPYEKIFNDQSNDRNHFINYFQFHINANRPMSNLVDSMVALLREHGNDVGDAIKVRPNGKYF